jgi:hypothetical protein
MNLSMKICLSAQCTRMPETQDNYNIRNFLFMLQNLFGILIVSLHMKGGCLLLYSC